MTRTMYDSVTAADIPATARLVAGYVDGYYAWSLADWARFKSAVEVRIVVSAKTNRGHCLDVETGDAAPGEAPAWVTMRRQAGVDPSVYMNASTWPAVRSAFHLHKVAEPHYWVADWDGVAEVPAGAIAKQYANPTLTGHHYDLSLAGNYWPGVDPPPTVPAPAPVPVRAIDGVRVAYSDLASLLVNAIPNAAAKIREVIARIEELV